jgi:adenylate cyclase
MAQYRQLAAIMFTDVVGYTALMGNDEEKAFDILNRNRALQKPIIEQFNGRWIKELGDGVMASFHTVSDAVLAAMKIQEGCMADGSFQLRIGIHQSEVVFENDDVFGDGVNIAARIQSAAKPGTIYISESVYQNVSNRKDITTRYVNATSLKNVKEPVRIHQVVTGAEPEPESLSESKTVPTQDKSIAVLPFANMSSDPEQEYFSDGISEEIINMLAQVPGLRVAGRTSSFSFKGKNLDLRVIGEQLNVSHILEGSVRKSGNKLRITAQLINVKDGYHLYSEKFDRELKDVFEIQDEISLAILHAIKLKLFEGNREVVLKRYTENAEAYQYYLQGRYHVNRYQGTEAFLNGIKYYEEAIKLEPGYALAYAGMAYCYLELLLDDLMPREQCLTQLRRSVMKAMELDGSNAESIVALANFKIFVEWEFQGIDELYRKALSINPNSPDAHRFYAFYLLFTGKFELALHEAGVAIDLDPFSIAGNWEMAWVFIYSGQLDKGKEMGERLVRMEPSFFGGHLILAYMMVLKQRFDEAIVLADKAAELYPFSMTLRTQAVVRWKRGDHDGCRRVFARMKEFMPEWATSNRDMGVVQCFMGEYAEAARTLSESIDNKEGMMLFAREDLYLLGADISEPAIAEQLKRLEVFKSVRS